MERRGFPAFARIRRSATWGRTTRNVPLSLRSLGISAPSPSRGTRSARMRSCARSSAPPCRRASDDGAQLLANAQLEARLDMLVGLLGRDPFFCGNAPTAADFAIFGPLQGLRQEMTPAARQRVDAHATLVAWMKRVDEAAHGEHTAPVT